MHKPRNIAILLHEKDPYPDVKVHFIWGLCELWRQAGHRVEIIKGARTPIQADLLIPHVDLTVLPAEYAARLEQCSRVVNRRVRDISKRLISRQLVTGDDDSAGPVIVKTNLNFGGAPEAQLLGTPIQKNPRLPWWKRLGTQGDDLDWAKVRSLNPAEYRIFPSVKKVPRSVFVNDSLVVERFLPELENGLYHLRIYQFFGNSDYCVRLGSKEPIVKTQSVVTREEVAAPPELVAIRRELGLDYGKMDFVIRDGQVVLFDVNRTPGLIQPPERMAASAQRLAPGLAAFF